MTNLFFKMAKIIVLSLFIATTALVILYFIIFNQVINDQADRAKMVTDSLIVMKYSQMLSGKSFNDIIKTYSKKTDIKFRVYSLFDQKYLPFDKNFLNKVKTKPIYKFQNSKLIYYRPLFIENECLKCHGGIKKNHYTGFKKGDFIGILEAELPVEKQISKYNLTFLLIFSILFIALVFTLYYFYDYMKTIRRDITSILLYFKNKIAKGVYEPLKEKMYYKEFEILKKEINNAVRSIVYYRDELIKSYSTNDLTKLPNRVKLLEDLKKQPFNLAILNINSFREINDYFGQEVGDELIKLIGQRIKKMSGNVYHINVDEFALPLPFDEKEKNFKYINYILSQLEKPYKINDKEIILTFRCGMSKTKENLLITADIALEYAKRRKVKCLCFCDIKETIKEFEKNLQILSILVKAIKNDKVKVYYQAIVDNKTLKPVKYEVLVRIEDENGVIYSPGVFLDIAKSANLYPEITKTVFKKALEKFKNKNEMISLNLDFEDFENERIREFILNEIDNFPNPQNITVELLENEDITESTEALKFLKTLKNKGVQIFIDDFGSGYSNFSYLFRFEINGFKIDGSLIKNILTDKKSQMIVETIVEFAKKGNMKVVAEYVENEDIYMKIKNLGIDYSQGYYFSKPTEFI